MSLRTKQQDKELGDKNEIEMRLILERLFSCDFHKDSDEYAAIDFYNTSKSKWVETKRRQINHDAFSTVMISAHKVSHCVKKGCEYYFIWKYNDGVWGLRYNKLLFDTFEKRMYKRHDRADHVQQPSLHYFIPIKHLQCFVPNEQPLFLLDD
jgi:hypothetical protein